MGGAPSPPPLPPPPPPPIAATDPGVEEAKQKEITRLAQRTSAQSTIKTISTQKGLLAGEAAETKKTTLGGA
jgi:hypothetical protein